MIADPTHRLTPAYAHPSIKTHVSLGLYRLYQMFSLINTVQYKYMSLLDWVTLVSVNNDSEKPWICSFQSKQS
jgi:hypothetical protein